MNPLDSHYSNLTVLKKFCRMTSCVSNLIACLNIAIDLRVMQYLLSLLRNCIEHMTQLNLPVDIPIWDFFVTAAVLGPSRGQMSYPSTRRWNVLVFSVIGREKMGRPFCQR